MGGTEVYKNIELEGRNWSIKKLDAQTATYYAQECLDKILPSGFNESLGIKGTGKTKFTKQEFFDMQKDFLKVCFEDLEAGKRPVLDRDGNYGVVNVEENGPLLQLLLLNSMVHSLKGFFLASHLKLTFQAISDLFPQNAPTSEASGSTLQ